MNRITLLLLAALIALAVARTPKIPGQSDCGLNEIFRECSTMCEEKCGEYVPTRACPASCGPPKCQCDVGFYRNSTGSCITRAQCEGLPALDPPTCSLPCPYGETCVLETVFCKKAPCPKRPSCRLLQIDPVPQTCKAVTCGFGQTCVEEPLPCFVAPCPVRAICRPTKKTCAKKNEIWSQCFTGCEATCQTRLKACTLQCGPGGCQCESGYIRDETSGQCVLERDCPNACAANEKYDVCHHGCEATCSQPNPACTEQCGPGGCRCTDGLVRDERTKRCIRQSECSRRG